MANNKDFKVKNGIKPAAYQEAVGTATSGSVTVGYDLASAAYDSKSFSVSSQEANPRSTTFKTDGTKMYVVGNNNNTVYQYSLSTSFDVSTASYDTISSNISANSGPYSYSLTFNPDGTKMYTIGQLQSSPYDYRIYQYTLSTAWDLSTITYDTLFAFAYGTYGVSTGFCFNNNGTKFYLTSNTSNSILQWSLSTAYDVSTASYDSVTFSVASQTTTPTSIAINTSGTKIIVLGANDNALFQYDLSTAFSLSTASYNSVSFSVSSPTAATKNNMVFNPDGTKVYLTASGVIYQYSTGSITTTNTLDQSTGSVFEVTSTANTQVSLSNPAANGTVSSSTLLLSTSATAYTITWDSSIKWSGGTAPDSPAASETDVYYFSTRDGGTSYIANIAIDGAK